MTCRRTFNIDAVRNDFPYLALTPYNKPLIYFDNAATSQKPQHVIDAILNYYRAAGNINRAAHYLSEQATLAYIAARQTIATHIGADASNIVITSGTTASINLAAHSLAPYFSEGDEIVLTEMEHHSNIVPWYLLAQEKKLTLKVAKVLDNGSLDIEDFQRAFSQRTKLAAFTHASNALGTINPIKEMIAIAKSFNVPTIIDGAQAIPHLRINVTDLDVDFYAFSGHKIYGPCGVGVLFAKGDWLERMRPYQGGGDMIKTVDFSEITFADGPQKFEAGTPAIAEVLGLDAALTYLEQFNFAELEAHEHSLRDYAYCRMKDLPHVRIIGGDADARLPIISFVVDGIHPHDLSSIFDREGIAIRAGHLCAQPIMKRYHVSALARMSLAFYNTHAEIDRFIHSFTRVFEVFRL